MTMYGIALSIAFILIAIGEWRMDPFPKPFRLRLGYALLYGMDVVLVLLRFWDLPLPNFNQLMIWLMDPVARPLFDWLKGGVV